MPINADDFAKSAAAKRRTAQANFRTQIAPLPSGARRLAQANWVITTESDDPNEHRWCSVPAQPRNPTA